MNKIKLTAGVILVFLVGALAGALGTGIYFKQRIGRFADGGPPVPVRVQTLLKKFSDELDLTDVQRTELEKILLESQEKILALGRKIFPEIEEINEQSFASIKDKLNSEQKEKLDIIHQKMKRFHDRFAKRVAFPGRTGERIIPDIKERLNLTKEQEIKVRSIIKKGLEERRKIRKRRDMLEIEKSIEKELADVLTEKQMEEYRRLREVDGRL